MCFYFPSPSVFLPQRWPKCFRNNIVNWSSLNNSAVAWSDSKKRTTHLINQPELKALRFVKMFIFSPFELPESLFWNTFFLLSVGFSLLWKGAQTTRKSFSRVVSVKWTFFREYWGCCFSNMGCCEPFSAPPWCSGLTVLSAGHFWCALLRPAPVRPKLPQKCQCHPWGSLAICNPNIKGVLGAAEVAFWSNEKLTYPFHKCFCFSLNK